MKNRTLVGLVLLLVFAVSAFAQVNPVPPRMNFQGRLAKPDGTPIPDGTYKVRFSLHTDVAAGNEVWNLTVNPVTVKNGVFGVQLTGLTTAMFASDLWLQMTVGNDPALAPRQPLASVAYAFKADSVRDGSITSASILDGSITGTDIASNTITGSNIANGTITTGNLTPNLANTLNNANFAYHALVGAASSPSYPVDFALSGNFLYTVDINAALLQIFDLGTPTVPALVGSVATGAFPSGVAVSGNYAYVVSSANTLQIFDITTKTALVQVGSVATSTSPTAVAVSGNYAYVVTTGGDNLQVFDITIKTAPVPVKSVAAGADPTHIVVVGTNAYVVSIGDNRLRIFNISNPALPTLSGSVATANSSYRLAVSGSYAYVPAYNASVLQVFDISVPTVPLQVRTVATGTAPYGVVVSGTNVHVTAIVSQTLETYSFANPAAPVRLGTTSLGAAAYGIIAGGSYLYTGIVAPAALRVYQAGATGLTVPNLNVSGYLSVGTGILGSSGSLPVLGNLRVDAAALNNGKATNALLFGENTTGEGIASKRTTNGNQYGLDFYTAGVNRLAITNTGNIGIGTTAPETALHIVNGGFRITSDADVNTVLGSGVFQILNGSETIGMHFDYNEIQTINDHLYINNDHLYNTNINGFAVFAKNQHLGLGVADPLDRLMLPNTTTNGDGRGLANSWVTYSSGRWKHNVVPIDDALAKVLQLNGVMFDWNEENGGGHDIGFVAEDVGKIVPELIIPDRHAPGFAAGMKYDRVGALLVEAVKTLKKEIDVLKAENAALKRRVRQSEAVERRLQRLEKQLEALVSPKK